ncbi:MAG: hypothetical protein KDA73_09140 [Rhodobacteraceae bacterium]|nr:hypothetical protein [Paracoccaceae bacterium]
MKDFPGVFRRNSLEIQFWGYESGNVLASITGSGGPKAFAESLLSAWAGSGGSLPDMILWLARDYPETFATLGVLLLVALAHPVSRLAQSVAGSRASDAVNLLAVPLALGLLGYVLVRSANLFTVSACAFVVASCFLRGAALFPLLLKIGGLCLVLGGLALSAAGASVFQAHLFGASTLNAAVSLITVLTGLYVAGAGALTYIGGIFESESAVPSGRSGLLDRVLDPRGSLLAASLVTRVDPVVRSLVRRVILPAVFWVDADTKTCRPFRTSMMARLPWRLLAGTAALATGTDAGLCFAIANLLWALGDVAIGALDGPLERPEPLRSSGPQ